ncbi:SufE family protein [Pseudomonas sp.]|uniref:SufE family protein n=1 Tax=Pseudomonas sp. TaxID=306 RepID=UPI0028A9A094|nr:SufE family protein [Pseudomonas sp.]
MSLPNDAQAALEHFAAAQGWEQRARLLMQWGERLAPMAEAEKTEANRVHGCESQVWLVVQRDGARRDGARHGGAQHDGVHWQFKATSDARLLRGLLALLLVRVEGLDRDALAALDLRAWFAQLGLERQLSPSRSNGLHAVVLRMAELLAKG